LMVTNGYCGFRIAEAYYQTIPSSWWIAPPAYEKDQGSTEDAAVALRLFVRKYPKSKFVERANKYLKRAKKLLANHEWYVANFYWEKNKPMGTVLRLRRLLKRYDGVGHDGNALWLLGKAYIKVKEPKRAKETWQRLVKEYPKHKRSRDAAAAILKISG